MDGHFYIGGFPHAQHSKTQHMPPMKAGSWLVKSFSPEDGRKPGVALPAVHKQRHLQPLRQRDLQLASAHA